MRRKPVKFKPDPKEKESEALALGASMWGG